eukprot:scaffold6937_cov110-Isochrysis_galbana.AAC.7
MEQLPADARAAPSASAPNDIVMDIASSPKPPRDPAQDNKVSQRATHFDPAMREEPARACQSLAHHTTLTGRCRKSVDTWAPLSEESQSRSTTTTPAERLGNHGNSAILAAVHQHRQARGNNGGGEGECPDGRRAEEPSHVAATSTSVTDITYNVIDTSIVHFIFHGLRPTGMVFGRWSLKAHPWSARREVEINADIC